jgi:ribonuclease Y
MDTFLLAICITAIVAAGAGYVLRVIFAKLNAKSAEQVSERIIKEAKLIAETQSKEALLQAKVTIDKERKEFEQEFREKKQTAQSMENRLNQREEHLDRKIDAAEKRERETVQKEKDFVQKEQKLSAKFVEVEKIKTQQKETLERISGMTKEDAKNILIKSMEDEAKRDATITIQRIEQETRENADRKS